MRSAVRTSLMLITLTFSVIIAASNPRAHGQGGGPFPGPCPVNPTPPPNSVPCLAIVPQEQTLPSPGGTLTISVTTLNMPTFSGWDIAIKTNNTVLNPRSLAVMETFGGTFQSTSNCINGSGLGCSGNDGAGIAHSAGFSFGANDAGNTTLFTVTYTVVAGPSTNVTFVNSPSEPSSVTDPSGFSLVDCSAIPNQCLTGSVSVVDFVLSVSPASIGPLGIGASGSSTITVTPENGFVGTLDLTASPTPANPAVTVNLASPSVTITSSSGPQTDRLTASASLGGTFNINVTASITGFPSRTVIVPLKVTDYNVTAHPNTLPLVRGVSGITNITVTPLNGFTGTVNLVPHPPPEVTATLDFPSVTITSGNQNDTLTVSSSTTGTYRFNVTASSTGFPSHNATVTVIITGLSSTTTTNVVNDGTSTTTGASFHDTASVTGSGTTPTGNLTYSFFNNSDCSGTARFTRTVILSGTTVPNSNSTGPLGAGSYAFQATYNGDVNYTPSTSSCESFTVAKAPSTTSGLAVLKSGAPLPSLVPAGSRVNGTATVTGVNGFPVSGNLVYRFFNNSACSSPAFFSQNVTLSGGLVPDSIATSLPKAGSYSFNATFGGDVNYLSSKSTCQSFVVDDFTVGASPADVGTLASGVQGSTVVTITAVNGFTGTVGIAAVPAPGFSASLNMSSVVLSSTVTSKNVLLVVNGTLGNAYSVVINGTSSGFPFHTFLVSATVQPPSIAIGTPSVSATSVSVGDKVTVDVTLTDNSVGVPFTTIVWLKWGDLTVAQKNVTLTPGQSTPVSLVWDTTEYTAGSNSLSVVVPAAGATANAPTVSLSPASSSPLSLSNPYILALLGVAAAVVVVSLVFFLRRNRRSSAS